MVDLRSSVRDDEPFLASGSPRPPRSLGLAWTLLVVNTLGSQGADTIVAIPRLVAQAVTMGSLVGAFVLALVLNPRLRVRPSSFLLLLTLLVAVSVVSSVRLESGYGALFRCLRFALFVATLWLLTPWWRDSLTLVRHQVRALAGVLVTVLAGLAISPGMALPEAYGGRVVGALWPLTPPQVGQYAAIVLGIVLLLRLGGRTTWRSTALFGLPAVALLLLSHTRTAALALVAGLALALVSLVAASPRARRVLTRAVLVAGLGAVLAGPALLAWFRRGQDDLAELTGRQQVWDALLAAPRDTGDEILGVGLTNKSFDGLPIDSSWLAVYHEQGYVGVLLVVLLLGVLVAAAALRGPSLPRACAVFLVVYCVVSSYTEAGLGDASPYLLYLFLAAALLSADRGQVRA